MYTSYGVTQIKEIFKIKRSVYFIGIGGISMSSLAHIAMSMGMKVGGYDRTPSHLTEKLERDGANIAYSLDPAHIEDYDVIIYTAAIGKDNPELAAALEYDSLGTKFCIYRADFLGYLMSTHKNRIGVSGMHGKSSATSMIAHIFLAAELDPTIVSGAELAAIGGAYRIGSKDNFIMEACEYQDSFLSFTPNIAVILNIDMDHPDYFSDIEQIIGSYKRYLSIAQNGYAVINGDCENTLRAAREYTGTLVSFGVESDSDFTAKNITFDHGRAEFDIIKKGNFLTHAKLGVIGKHHVMNALASAAAADICGVPSDAISKGLASFTGAKRRMELRGNVKGLASGASVPLYDDYAHHPTEIRATLSGALELGYNRVFAVFQPHTYSRTSELFDQFSRALNEFTNAGGKLILADIYAAREANVYGVSSKKLADTVAGAIHLPTFENIAEHLKSELTDGDVLIVMGAGDVIKLDDLLL